MYRASLKRWYTWLPLERASAYKSSPSSSNRTVEIGTDCGIFHNLRYSSIKGGETGEAGSSIYLFALRSLPLADGNKGGLNKGRRIGAPCARASPWDTSYHGCLNFALSLSPIEEMLVCLRNESATVAPACETNRLKHHGYLNFRCLPVR